MYCLLTVLLSCRDCYLCFLGLLAGVHKDVLDCKLGGGCIDLFVFIEEVELVSETFEGANQLFLVVVANCTYGKGYVSGVLL